MNIFITSKITQKHQFILQLSLIKIIHYYLKLLPLFVNMILYNQKIIWHVHFSIPHIIIVNLLLVQMAIIIQLDASFLKGVENKKYELKKIDWGNKTMLSGCRIQSKCASFQESKNLKYWKLAHFKKFIVFTT